ncbi:DNA-binding response regulator, OmpR family, contains REC and winged-helix (wHTH) domain [Clostridium acidisoli DSM 12555]|uniref:Stage 0 sporulation protein A homolog n=1 Tax=Clostridium acidisoli DSM 12555 TaxID=1121291 RepID=A0A1W1XRL2_9CLOT|nr:DNA-binding response regulator, OmpR family, contains REC and winged-helix (wHTH) domain [Clostridium acidisoli DSM 12555]
MTNRVLIADDDKDIVDIIADTLMDEGYFVSCAYNGLQVIEIMKSEKINLFILDIMMPEMDGLETLRQIKKKTDAPVLILSARGRDIDKVVGLQIGADDYVAKPFSMDELVARVNAHLRREQKRGRTEEIVKIGNVELNKTTWRAFVNGSPLDLSTKEFQILSYLFENKNRVLTREQIYAAIWKDPYAGDLNTVTVHIKNLRSKLGKEGKQIKTVWGIGYKLDGDV